ncbi:MAG: cell division protein ZapD [Pseudomonadota bacterium]
MLRLEHLFRQANHFLSQESQWCSRAFIDTLLDILDIFSRGDFKTELIKELERATGNLRRLMEYPHIDHDRLGTILRALEHLTENIHSMKSQPGQELRDDEFITTIRQRSSIPGGTCDFDLPVYHHWLEMDRARRREDEKRWFATLDPVRQAIELLLKMIRNSAEPSAEIARGGGFQKQLESGLPYQMVRVMLEQGAPCYAEVSGSKHRIAVRFLTPVSGGRAKATYDDIDFKIAICSL